MPQLLAPPPNELNANAIGRIKEIQDLHTLFQRVRKPVTVTAVGGLGKTTVAQMFWQKHHHDYENVAWVFANAVFTSEGERRADNAEMFIRAFTDNAHLKQNLQITFDPQALPIEHFRQVVARLATEPGRNLLVIDNTSEAAAVYVRELSALENWHILITSRDHIQNTEHVELDALSPDEARTVFENTHGEKVSDVEKPSLDETLKTYAYHTLTIELLAAYSREKNLTPSSLKAELAERGLLGLKKYELENPKSHRRQSLHAHLFETFLMELSEPEKEIMRYCCILPPLGQPMEAEHGTEEFLRGLFGKQDSEEEFHNVLHALARLNWLVYKDRTFRCHPVITETAQAQLLPDAENCATLIANVTKLLTPDAKTNEPVIARAPFASLGESVLKGVWKGGGYFIMKSDLVAGDLALRLGWLFEDLGVLHKSLDYKEKVLNIREKVLPPEHPDLATSYSNVAMIFGTLGEYQKSLEYDKKAIEIREKVLSPEHPDLAISYNSFALTYRDLGEYQKSLEYNQKSVAIREKVLSPEHPNLATSYNSLALTYGDLGEYQKSLEYNQKAIAIKKKVLPPEHPDLATSYNNLALAYGELGQHQKSLEYNQMSLAIREKVLPPEHPALAISYANLATAFGELGEHQKRLEYNQKAIAIEEKVLPPEHPELATSYNNLASTYGSLGEHQKRLEYNQKAIAIREKALPPEHPDLANSYNNLAWTHHALGDLDKACAFMRRAVGILEKALPPSHPDLLQSKEDLAFLEWLRG